MVFELANPTQQLLFEIADKVFKQADIATTYALAMRSSQPTDWPTVNAAIVERWSKSGLVRIKELAWKKHETYLAHRAASVEMTPDRVAALQYAIMCMHWQQPNSDGLKFKHTHTLRQLLAEMKGQDDEK